MLSPEQITELCFNIQEGLRLDLSLLKYGENVGSFRDWIARGRRDKKAGRETEYAKLVNDVSAAQFRFNESTLPILKELAKADYKSWSDYSEKNNKPIVDVMSEPVPDDVDDEELYQEMLRAAGTVKK
jgi:hypothetical protein